MPPAAPRSHQYCACSGPKNQNFKTVVRKQTVAPSTYSTVWACDQTFRWRKLWLPKWREILMDQPTNRVTSWLTVRSTELLVTAKNVEEVTGREYHCITISHPHTGSFFSIGTFINCSTSYVIYVLKCPCDLHLGKTSHPLKTHSAAPNIRVLLW